MRVPILPLFLMLSTLCPAGAARAEAPIPDDRRVDWSTAGCHAGMPADAATVRFAQVHPEFATDPDNGPELQALIDGLSEPTVVELPRGELRFRTGVTFDEAIHGHPVVVRGAGWQATRLRFDPESDPGDHVLFTVRGLVHAGVEVPVTSAATKGTRRLTLQDASPFRAGDTVVLRQDNNLEAMITYRVPDQPRLLESLETWAQRATGQVIEVAAVEGNDLVLARPLHLTLDWGGLTAQRVTPRTRVGFESFEATNAADVDETYLFNFFEAADCWMRDVRSVRTVKFHVRVVRSRNLSIEACFFDDAFRHGGGGHGYGVALEWATSDCLVMNNLFRRLRHTMMFSKGVVGNVFAYNYSFENTQSDSPVAKDISGHGHYAAMNLIEGNVAEFIHGTDYWGSLGPGNTYYRNRTTAAGIRLDVYSPRQNAIANEILVPLELREQTRWDPAESFFLNHVTVHTSVGDPLVFANVTPEDPRPPAGTPALPPSLFLAAPPAFWPEALPWPALGPPNPPGAHAIPAQLRWTHLRGDYK